MLSSIFYNKINHSVEEIKKFQTLSDKLSSKFIINTVIHSFIIYIIYKIIIYMIIF